jgi:hypothetical protein
MAGGGHVTTASREASAAVPTPVCGPHQAANLPLDAPAGYRAGDCYARFLRDEGLEGRSQGARRRCGTPGCPDTAGNVAHHVQARTAGDPDVPHNLTWTCEPCHARVRHGGARAPGGTVDGSPADRQPRWHSGASGGVAAASTGSVGRTAASPSVRRAGRGEAPGNVDPPVVRRWLGPGFYVMRHSDHPWRSRPAAADDWRYMFRDRHLPARRAGAPGPWRGRPSSAGCYRGPY